ncbi:PTS sugar transporter subunit IIA [Budvicia diplopodorum]|uniref:PTS sugar transporter subunit IIA n=1 Tax=Budvicia diplopodorum TaxID=1119056 RepID=UPI001358AA84|nr:PTS sugar transporter subunit IIA [Budvicia diplopodorum]
MIEDRRAAQARRHAALWQEAVTVAAGPLIELGHARPEYIQGIIDNTKEYGPYYIIAPGIALPHARPEQGALRNGVVFTTLAQPIAFGHEEGDPVWLLIAISATDAEQHIKTIQQLAELLQQSEFIQSIKQSTTDGELYQLLSSVKADG